MSELVYVILLYSNGFLTVRTLLTAVTNVNGSASLQSQILLALNSTGKQFMPTFVISDIRRKGLTS